MRCYADAAGESHFEEVGVGVESVDFAPPAPPLGLSPFVATERFSFVAAPAGWRGDWHPAPRRQFFFCLSGEYEMEVSDGEVRRFRPGSVVLVEDTTGKGHVTRVLGEDGLLTAVVQLTG